MTHLMIHVLQALAALTAWAGFLLIRPHKPCRRCRGWGVRGRRRNQCPRCGGTGYRFRTGARLVHRAAATAIKHATARRNREDI